MAIFASLGTPPARAYAYDGLPEVEVFAAAALLVDADAGTYLFEKNIHDRREPASLTKIMTCMLALEIIGDEWDIRKDETVTVTPEAFTDITAESSTSGLKAGEMIRLEDLIYCVMLQSANEGSNVLAIHLLGSTASFVDHMNRRAKELGCESTHFANPHGLPHAEHYTTALDVYTLAEQAVKTPHFMTVAHTNRYVVPATNKSAERILNTTNRLISTSAVSEYYYPAAKGIKTGFTDNAGYCLASTAEKDGRRLVSVVMGAEPNRHFIETKLLFDWGFENFTQKRLLAKTQMLAQVEVRNGIDKDHVTLVPEQEIVALVPKNLDPEEVTRKVSLHHPEGMYAPILRDEILGTVTLEYEGHVYGTVNLLASFSIEENTAMVFLLNVREWFSKTWIKRTLGALAALVLLYVALTVALNLRRQRERNRKPGNYRGRRR